MRRLLVVFAMLAGFAVPSHAAAFTVERVRVPMRDGVELSVMLYRPVTTKRVPVILQLTPYHSLYYGLDPVETDLPAGDAEIFVPKDYAYALADVRGTWASGGCWDYGGLNERRDGYDLVEWLGTRGWSNGKVAMTGASYDGTTANAAAVERPPHLATIVPVSAISRWWGYAYQQGARASYSGESADIDPPSDTPTDFMFAYGTVPPPDPVTATSAQQVAMRWNLCDRVAQTLHGYSTQPDYDQFWIDRDYLRLASRVNVPVLVSHGLQDFNVKTWEGTQWFEALRVPKIMVLGQWPHASPRGRYPEWNELLEKWFARWLYGVRNNVERELSLRVQANDREWRAEAWGRTKKRALPLKGQPVTIVDDGLLTESEMLRLGPNPRWVRVAVPGSERLRFQGRPRLTIPVTSDSASTHVVAVLCDVATAGGPCTVVSRAFLNARYRDGLTAGKDLVPGTTYAMNLDFVDKDWVLADGHHLELIVASSSNTWVLPDERRARNTFHLDKAVLTLPVR